MTWTEQDYQRELLRLEALEAFHRARRERQQKDPLLIQYDLQQRLRGRPGLWPDGSPDRNAAIESSPSRAQHDREVSEGPAPNLDPPL